jgi:hypothetical protein
VRKNAEILSHRIAQVTAEDVMDNKTGKVIKQYVTNAVQEVLKAGGPVSETKNTLTHTNCPVINVLRYQN